MREEKEAPRGNLVTFLPVVLKETGQASKSQVENEGDVFCHLQS